MCTAVSKFLPKFDFILQIT